MPRTTLGLVALALTPGLLVLAVTFLAVAAVEEVTLASMFMDPVSAAGLLPTTGAASLAGCLLWAASATSALVGAVVLWRAEPALARFLLGWGVISGVLCLDDTFLLHEAVIPAATGLPEEATFGLYGLGLLALLVAHRRLVLARTPVVLLGLTLLLLGASLVADVLQGVVGGTWRLLAEDGLKLLAISGWTGYTVALVLGALRGATGSRPTAGATPAPR